MIIVNKQKHIMYVPEKKKIEIQAREKKREWRKLMIHAYKCMHAATLVQLLHWTFYLE